MIKRKGEILEDATPNPEFLIKSISEQGYSLETSLADLVDNSIFAKADKIEILVNIEKEPFTMYLADNGLGMDEKTLRASMQFPSSSPEASRDGSDLGRFGLGMKTASFSQTRRFTVLSRLKGEDKYKGRTWDVHLLKNQSWKLLINQDEQIDEIIASYQKLSSECINAFEGFLPNTIVVWEGLYKFENYLEEKNRQTALKKELNEVTSEHLELVFHRFIERKNSPLQIRINNKILVPFNPFPTNEQGFRSIEDKQKSFGSDFIKIEGFVLPSRSINETRSQQTCWTTSTRSLMDMEGIYIYRLDRIILFGGWNGVIKKAPKLQLARLRVEIGNSADHLLHLNVAKSKVIIPHDLVKAFENYIEELKIEAEREYFNRGLKTFSGGKSQSIELFSRVSTNKGTMLELSPDFPILKSLKSELNKDQIGRLKVFIRMINTTVNKIRQNHEDKSFVGLEDEDGMSIKDLIASVKGLLDNGVDPATISKQVLPQLGFKKDSLPDELHNLLKEN
jgi:hypothetical protein